MLVGFLIDYENTFISVVLFVILMSVVLLFEVTFS